MTKLMRSLTEYMRDFIFALVLGRARTILVPPVPETEAEWQVVGPLTQQIGAIHAAGGMVDVPWDCTW